MALTAADVETFERCMSVGGYAVFPADTVYGLACDPDAKEALQRIYRLKRRPMDKPSAILFFSLATMHAALPELDAATRAAADALLPGPVTLLVPNPAGRYPLACAREVHTLGVRVPALDDTLAPLAAMRWPILQTSANLSGAADARTLHDVPEPLRTHADLLLDAGPRPGTSSTVVDLRAWSETGEWSIVRHGAMSADAVGARLASSAA